MNDEDRLRLDLAHAISCDLLYAHGPMPDDASPEMIRHRMDLIHRGVEGAIEGGTVIISRPWGETGESFENARPTS